MCKFFPTQTYWSKTNLQRGILSPAVGHRGVFWVLTPFCGVGRESAIVDPARGWYCGIREGIFCCLLLRSGEGGASGGQEVRHLPAIACCSVLAPSQSELILCQPFTLTVLWLNFAKCTRHLDTSSLAASYSGQQSVISAFSCFYCLFITLQIEKHGTPRLSY